MFEGVGVAAVEPAAGGVLDGLDQFEPLGLRAVDINKAHVGALVCRAAVVDDVGGNVDDLAADSIKRARAQMGHGNNCLVVDNLGAYLLEAAQEHPALHGDHGRVAAVLGKAESALDKTRAKVALHVGVVLLDPFAHEGVKAAAAHIRRDRKSTRLNSSHTLASRMPSSA